MPCPHISKFLDESRDSRRGFLKSMLAVGGTSALSACIERGDSLDIPDGTSDPSTLPSSQHVWNEYLPRDQHGNIVPPSYQLLLFLEYTGSSPPTERERERVAGAFRSLVHAYQYGNGGTKHYSGEGTSIDGLLFSMGYSPRYFQRFDDGVPASVDLPPPDDVIERLEEEAPTPHPHDAVCLLTSDYVQVLLSAEEALFGSLDTLNGVEMSGSFEGVFERRARWAGFKERGLVSDRLENDAVPRESPGAMGFRSNFKDTQPPEEKVTIADGRFAGGTTQHVSRVELFLDEWYDADEASRVAHMFSPDHTPSDVGDVGDDLAGDSGITEDIVAQADRNARDGGVVGHAQKTAEARDEEFDPRILRRSEGIAVATDTPMMNFTSVQRGIGDFVETRQAMNGVHLDSTDEGDGIREFITVTSRGNYLVPPRDLIALPVVER